MLNMINSFRAIIKNHIIPKNNYINNPISLCEFKI